MPTDPGVVLTFTHRDSGDVVRHEGGLPVVVGRQEAPDTIVLDEVTVSRRHARIEFDGLRLTVVDLDSVNGTTVNGDLVTRHRLADGDRLTIGSYVVAWTLPGVRAATQVVPLLDAGGCPARRVVQAAEAHNAAAGHELDGFLSLEHGFLPTAPPLTALPDSHRAWDSMVDGLPGMFRDLSLRREFDRLPVLDAGPDALPAAYLLRASTMLGVFAHAYHYLTPDPPPALPESLDTPWRTVSTRLGKDRPAVSYIDLFFYNWRLRDPDGPRRLDNMDLLVPARGNAAERIFYLVTTEFAMRQTPVLAAMLDAQEAVLARDRDALAVALLQVMDGFRGLTEIVYRQIDPNPYGANHLDQVLWAKTVGTAGVPIVEGAPSPSGTAQPHTHAIDAFLERRAYDSLVGRQSTYLAGYFPRHWRELIAALRRVSVRGFVEDTGDAGLRGLYNAMLDAYAGDRGWMGLHRIKAYGFLEVAFKVGREVATGARFTGLFSDRTWNLVDRELATVRDERRPPVPPPVVFGRPLGGTLHTEAGTGPDSGAWTCHVELDVSGQGVHHHPGDRIGVLAENADELVRRTLRAMQATGDELVGLTPRWRDAVALRAGYSADTEVLPLRTLLTFGRIRPVDRATAKRLVALSASGSLGRIVGARMEDQWELWDLVNLLHAGGFDVTRLWRADPRDEDSVCVIVPPEEFRFYSIASAPPGGEAARAGASSLHLVVGGYSSPRTSFSYPQSRHGSASHFLRRVATDRRYRNKRISLRVMPTPRFRLPEDLARPVVMFAAGSGIAPFRGFVQARDAEAATGETGVGSRRSRRGGENTVLYLGLRGPGDGGGFAYADDLAGPASRGHLAVHTAFSRTDSRARFDAGTGGFVVEPAPRRRVGDLITSPEHAGALWELLRPVADGGRGGIFYVCGHTGFAVSVLDALEAVAADRLGSPEAGRELMRGLVAEGRLMQDVFTTYGGHALQGAVHDTSDLVRRNTVEHGYRMAVSGKVYDVSEFVLRHPGGPDIVRHYAGTDATDAYRQVRHHENPEIDAMLGMFEVGTLRRLRFGTRWAVVLTEPRRSSGEAAAPEPRRSGGEAAAPDGLRFVTLEELFTEWVRFTYLVVGMENALASDYGFVRATSTGGEDPAAPSVFKDQFAVETHRRFLVSYLDGLTGDDLRSLWRTTAGFCAAGADVRDLDRRIERVHASAEYRLVRNLTGFVRRWPSQPEQAARLKRACALFRREDTAALARMKEALRTGLVAFETHEADVVARAGTELVAAVGAVTDAVDGYYRRLAAAAAELGVTADDLPDVVVEAPVPGDAGIPGHGGPFEAPDG